MPKRSLSGGSTQAGRSCCGAQRWCWLDCIFLWGRKAYCWKKYWRLIVLRGKLLTGNRSMKSMCLGLISNGNSPGIAHISCSWSVSGRHSWPRARRTSWLKKLPQLSMIRAGNGRRQVGRSSGSPQRSQMVLRRRIRRRKMMKNLILIKVRVWPWWAQKQCDHIKSLLVLCLLSTSSL